MPDNNAVIPAVESGNHVQDPGKHAPEMRTAFLLQPKFTLSSFSCFVDTLRHAADQDDLSRQILCQWLVIGEPDLPVESSCGFEIRPDCPVAALDLSELDYLIVVGGLLSIDFDDPEETYALLNSARSKGVGIVGLCTGFYHIARAGILANKRCCIPWIYNEQVSIEHPDIIKVLGQAYVEDDDIFTALGGVAPIRLALDIVEKMCGKTRAQKCADRLCVSAIQRTGAGLHSTQDEFNPKGNHHLEQAVEAMRHLIESPIPIESLADKLGISSRQLNNIFRHHTGKPPANFWRDMRLREATWRLANGSETITQIAYATGFCDSSHFSRCFKQAFGETPKNFRAEKQKADWSHVLVDANRTSLAIEDDPIFEAV